MANAGTQIRGRLTGRRIPKSMIPAGAEALPGAPKGTVVPTSSLDGLVRKILDGKFGPDPGIRFGDGSFYLPTQAEVEQILSASALDRRQWLAERFDCDDFAYVLKGEMSVHTYETADLKFGLCVGMVWGNFDWVDGFHAVNWFIANDQVLRFIEPQSDTVYDTTHCLGQISLLLV